MGKYEAVIGLEVHVRLATRSKLFCACANKFGAGPNENVCEVCAGMPGALPSPNAEAVRLAATVGMAVDCEINQTSRFARKNYFYPDLPSGYQISQFDLPICQRGHIDIDSGGETRRVGVTRIHMENDAGKNIHSSGLNLSFVDLNRAGSPLIEIVSEPDLRSSEDAVQYLRNLHRIVVYLGASDGNMEEGSFRCDANISLRPVGSKTLGVRTELKNLNSFRNVQRALDYEIERQAEELDEGRPVIQETRLYDADKNITQSMRGKEEAEDYRYFPDPDLPPIHISDEELKRWRSELPELPATRLKRFQTMTGLPEAETETLIQNKSLADFFESAAAKSEAKKAAAFILGPIARYCNANDLPLNPDAWKFTADALAELVNLTASGAINAKTANDILPDLFETGAEPKKYVEEKGLGQISSVDAIESAVDAVILANPDEARAYREGKKKVLSFLVGQVMRATKGKANPALVNELFNKKLRD